jgi:hypothetical protein
MSSSDSIDRRVLLGAAGLAGIAALGRMASAGPITPPAGPVGSTGHTVDEVYNKLPAGGAGDGRTALPPSPFGVTISAPGSYVLTTNLAVLSGNGITINASGVTLDLNGFTVSSIASRGGVGITIADGSRRVVVKNGMVSGFDVGVQALSATLGCAVLVLENLIIDRALATGIELLDTSSMGSGGGVTVRKCMIRDTGSRTTASDTSVIARGIRSQMKTTVVQDCVVSGVFANGAVGAGATGGISIDNNSTGGDRGCTVDRCVVSREAYGGYGISGSGQMIYSNNRSSYFAVPFTGGFDGGGNLSVP